MDPQVFWNKLQEMEYDDIIHWAETEEIKGIPEVHDSCLLAELGNKVTNTTWSFADMVYIGPNHDLIGSATPSMYEVMNEFDSGRLETFVMERELWR